MKARIAKPGDVVVRVDCRCGGSLVIASMAADYRCGKCRHAVHTRDRRVLTATGIEPERTQEVA